MFSVNIVCFFSPFALACKDKWSATLTFWDLLLNSEQLRQNETCSFVSCCSDFFLPPCQDDEYYEQTADVRSQLRFFEQLERIEKQRKDEQEREILLKAAKVSTATSTFSQVCVCVCEFLCLHATVCWCVNITVVSESRCEVTRWNDLVSLWTRVLLFSFILWKHGERRWWLGVP